MSKPIELPKPDMNQINYLPAADRLAYFTEVQLATVEDLRARKSFPKGELARHERIASMMVQSCRDFADEIRPHYRGGPLCMRLREILEPDPA